MLQTSTLSCSILLLFLNASMYLGMWTCVYICHIIFTMRDLLWALGRALVTANVDPKRKKVWLAN